MAEEATPLRWYTSRRAQRTIQEMLGLIRGIVCDGVVVDDEIRAFESWCENHPDVVAFWPATVLEPKVRAVLANRAISADDRHHLYELFCDAVGGGGVNDSTSQIFATRLPFDEPAPELSFVNRTYVFTGTFVFGTRKECEDAVVARGGHVAPRVTREPSIVVIGTLSTDAWAHSSYGRKIEAAVTYRDGGVPIQIVCEEHWTAAVRRSPSQALPSDQC